jgi:hypothetical protein
MAEAIRANAGYRAILITYCCGKTGQSIPDSFPARGPVGFAASDFSALQQNVVASFPSKHGFLGENPPLFTPRKQLVFSAQKKPHFKSTKGSTRDRTGLEERVAIGLILLAGVVALPVAGLSWLLGDISFGRAMLIYVLAGWSVIAAGFLSSIFAHLVGSAVPVDGGEPQPIAMKAKHPNRH